MPDGLRPAIPQVSEVDDLFGTHTPQPSLPDPVHGQLDSPLQHVL